MHGLKLSLRTKGYWKSPRHSAGSYLLAAISTECDNNAFGNICGLWNGAREGTCHWRPPAASAATVVASDAGRAFLTYRACRSQRSDARASMAHLSSLCRRAARGCCVCEGRGCRHRSGGEQVVMIGGRGDP